MSRHWTRVVSSEARALPENCLISYSSQLLMLGDKILLWIAIKKFKKNTKMMVLNFQIIVNWDNQEHHRTKGWKGL